MILDIELSQEEEAILSLEQPSILIPVIQLTK